MPGCSATVCVVLSLLLRCVDAFPGVSSYFVRHPVFADFARREQEGGELGAGTIL